jgi:hypothetical protein
MSRGGASGPKSNKKASSVERRRHPRGKPKSQSGTKKLEASHAAPKADLKKSSTKTRAGKKSGPALGTEIIHQACAHCEMKLNGSERALLVEEKIGRLFCSEECISSHFLPEIQKLERQYFRLVSNNDLQPEEREQLASLRWNTLESPDEVWVEKSPSGDERYILIGEYHPDGVTSKHQVWCVCVTLCLRGEPSFLYLAFVTKDPALVDAYRRGTPTELKPEETQAQIQAEGKKNFLDGRTTEWSTEESIQAEDVDPSPKSKKSKSADIQPNEYAAYNDCVDSTLETPNEVWSHHNPAHAGEEVDPGQELRIFHFIREFSNAGGKYWYVIIAQETEERDQIEIIENFPTRRAELVQKYRQGEQEISNGDVDGESHTVH